MTQKQIIMVVDDDIRITDLVKVSLEANGYEVIPVNDPRKAVAIAEDVKPRMILLDVSMPDKDGGQVAQELHANSATKRIPVTFLTGILSSKELGGSLGRRGSQTFLSKPAKPAELLDHVRETLG